MFSMEDRRDENAWKLFKNRVLCGRVKQLLSDSCNTREHTSRDTLFHMLRKRTLLGRDTTGGK